MFPEADSPGLKVVQGPFSSGGNDTAGCIMASSVATCDSPFQSGKRFKEQVTGRGPFDLVFDVDPNGVAAGADGHQVFQKIINQSGSALSGFTLSLGVGVGDDFVASTAGDGLGFSTSFEFGPDKVPAYSQFPFGLFGAAADNDNFLIDGFFAAERSGFELILSEDAIQTAGIFGPYPTLFGDAMLSQEDVPNGAFWDIDSDPTTDDILMAWERPDGMWELRRGEVAGAPVSLATALSFATLGEVEAFLGFGLAMGAIEDLANVNVNFAIDVLGFTGSSFTLRLQPSAVPLPATLPLLLAGLAFVGAASRRRRAA